MRKGMATLSQRSVDTSAKRSWPPQHSHSRLMMEKAETVPQKSPESLQEAKHLNLPPNAMDDLIDRLGGLKKAKSFVLEVLDRILHKDTFQALKFWEHLGILAILGRSGRRWLDTDVESQFAGQLRRKRISEFAVFRAPRPTEWHSMMLRCGQLRRRQAVHIIIPWKLSQPK